MARMVLPAASGRLPTSSAAAIAAPEEMPPGMPSLRASSRAVSSAVALLTLTISSITERVEDVWNEPRADALDLVRRVLPDRQHRTFLGLDGYDAQRRLAGLEHLADAGDGAAGTYAGDEEINIAAGVVPDFLRGGAAMDLGIGEVLELLRHHRVRRRPHQLFGG